MKKARILTFSLLAALFTMALGASPKAALAQATVGMRFSPVVEEINLDPGESFQGVVKFENRSSEDMTYEVLVQDFLPKGETGEKIFFAPDEVSGSFSLSKWVTLNQERVVAQPGENISVSYTVNVPDGAQPRGHYAAVLLSTVPKEGADAGENVATVTSKAGPILLVRVNGEAVETAQLVEFTTDRSSYEYPPVSFNTRVQNEGNIHIKPVGQITVKSMSGNVKATLPVNEALGNVLPESTRKFESVWEKQGFTLGKYTATLDLTYGNLSKKTLTDTVTFWIIPWKLLIIAGLALVILILAIKRYNSWIVERAVAEMKQHDKKSKR